MCSDVGKRRWKLDSNLDVEACSLGGFRRSPRVQPLSSKFAHHFRRMAIENVKHLCGRRYELESRGPAGLRELRCNGFGFLLPPKIRHEAKYWDELTVGSSTIKAHLQSIVYGIECYVHRGFTAYLSHPCRHPSARSL